MSTIAFHLGIKPDTLRRQYKKHESGFEGWDQASHAQEYLIFPENLSKYLAIDEVSLSKGELYTILSARDKRGRKGKMIACVASTKAEEIINVLERLPLRERMKVKEVTLDMASPMIKATGMCFPNATLVADRFHLIRLISEAVQQVRIDQRWMQIDKDNQDILQARKKGQRHLPKVLSNGDTLRKLLARSRYLLYKLPQQWTLNQQRRALLLFQHYPHIKQAYDHLLSFRKIFQLENLHQANQALDSWIDQATNSGIDYLAAASASIIEHKERILAFFNNRATNAHAESLNAQIKLFRANLRGVKDTNFFLFRLSKIFA
jgi:transposase